MKVFLALAALLVAASLLAPGAHAQGDVVRPTLSVSVKDPGQDLVPTRPNSLEIHVRYAYGPGVVLRPGETISITLENVQVPDWMTAKIETTNFEFSVPPEAAPSGGVYQASSFVNVTIDPLAPAETPGEYVVRATSTQRGNVAAATAESPRINLEAKFMGFLNVTGPSEVRLKGGRESVVTFLVRNDGNGETEVRLRVPTTPELSLVDAPGGLVLGRGEERTVDVRLRTPWVTSERGLLELEAVSVRAGEDAEPALFGVEVVGASVVPVPSAVALAALAAVAHLAPRRRR